MPVGHAHGQSLQRDRPGGGADWTHIASRGCQYSSCDSAKYVFFAEAFFTVAKNKQFQRWHPYHWHTHMRVHWHVQLEGGTGMCNLKAALASDEHAHDKSSPLHHPHCGRCDKSAC